MSVELAPEWEMAGPQPTYTDPDAVQFVEDMTKAGLTVRHYWGRSMWEGPSVVVSDLQDAMSETKVRVQYDNMGEDYVVYPKARDKGVWPE